MLLSVWPQGPVIIFIKFGRGILKRTRKKVARMRRWVKRTKDWTHFTLRTFRCNHFCRAQVASSNNVCKLATISISVRFRRDLSRDVQNLMQLCGDFWETKSNRSKCRTQIAQKSPLVYSCDKSCIGECDKNRIVRTLKWRRFRLQNSRFYSLRLKEERRRIIQQCHHSPTHFRHHIGTFSRASKNVG